MPKRVSTADALKQNIPEIMRRWESRALAEIPSTAGQTSLVLRNALPQFLGSIVTLLEGEKRTAAQTAKMIAESISVNKEHGRGRAQIPAYLISQLIFEYHVLREVLFQVLEAETPISSQERDLILSAMEQATRESAAEFTLTLKEIQDQFILSIAHDLKTPITAAQMGAELIARTPKAETTSPLAERVIEQTKRMTEMTESMLDSASIRVGKKLNLMRSECDLKSIVRDVVGVMRFMFGDWFVMKSDGPVIGTWNPEYLRRMVENLTHNAIKYSRPESQVTLSIKQTEEYAILEVHNLGEPIPPHEEVHLFMPFQRAETVQDRRGWGMGLALVKGIVDAFDGTIRVESTKENGTKFVVTLPKKRKASRKIQKVG